MLKRKGDISKIYFIYVPKPYLINPNVQIGLGLLSLATYARDLGCDIEVIDAQAERADWIPNIPDCSTVCISACSVDIPVVEYLGRGLKGMGCYVMLGGPISNSPGDVDTDSFCCMVKGPGESMMIELSKGMRPYGYRNVKWNLTFDNYPYPDRKLLKYYGGNIFHKKTGVEAEQSTTILTSRGCYFKCAFCVSGGNNCVYEYTFDRIGRELEEIKGLEIDCVRISDDNILAHRSRFGALCVLLKNYGMKWRASLRTKPNDIRLYEMMKNSGCIELSFGIESGDDSVLKTLKKGSSVATNSRAVENAIKAGIPNVRALMMMGTPGETEETLLLNQRWVRSHPKVTVCVCSFYPFPGTDIHDHPEKYGVTLENMDNPNIYMFRADESQPEAHISIDGGLSREELTQQLIKMRDFLIKEGMENRG
ncbi:MAG: radical SAM protein [bacterium]|nr:radical SAM protein [bacterium]